MAACMARCGSFQLLPDSTKANPASLNDFCLENVGCPRSSLGVAAVTESRGPSSSLKKRSRYRHAGNRSRR